MRLDQQRILAALAPLSSLPRLIASLSTAGVGATPRGSGECVAVCVRAAAGFTCSASACNHIGCASSPMALQRFERLCVSPCRR